MGVGTHIKFEIAIDDSAINSQASISSITFKSVLLYYLPDLQGAVASEDKLFDDSDGAAGACSPADTSVTIQQGVDMETGCLAKGNAVNLVITPAPQGQNTGHVIQFDLFGQELTTTSFTEPTGWEVEMRAVVQLVYETSGNRRRLADNTELATDDQIQSTPLFRSNDYQLRAQTTFRVIPSGSDRSIYQSRFQKVTLSPSERSTASKSF